MSDQTKTVNRKLVSIVPAKDSDGTEINIYTYEVEKNGKISTQTVKTRKTLKYKGNKYDANEHSQQVLDELIKYFNEYKFETSNQLEEFRIMTKNNEKLIFGSFSQNTCSCIRTCNKLTAMVGKYSYTACNTGKYTLSCT